MVFNFKRKTIIIASAVCIGVRCHWRNCCRYLLRGTIHSVDMQTESLSQSTPAESIQESVGESDVEDSVQSQTTESQTEEKKESIKYVEFNVTYAALEKALQIDIKSHEENAEVKISWIDLLAYLGAKYGGDFSKYQSSDMDTLVDKLQSGETMESLTEGMQYYAYYSKAYTAVLGGMVGNYQIETTSENGETVWQDKYGLIAYSPIAKNYPFEHYDDFGAQRTYGYKRQHLGHDLMAQTGTPVIAIESGIVEAVGWNQYGGWRLGIRSLDGTRYYYYAHLRQNRPYAEGIEEGKVVKAGDVIGYVGHTGYSTKENANNIEVPHLHLGMQLIFDESQKRAATKYGLIFIRSPCCGRSIKVKFTGLTKQKNTTASTIFVFPVSTIEV
ncbi:MAG: M23 family metallopeptidase [Acutalibacteraceae bacterium]